MDTYLKLRPLRHADLRLQLVFRPAALQKARLRHVPLRDRLMSRQGPKASRSSSRYYQSVRSRSQHHQAFRASIDELLELANTRIEALALKYGVDLPNRS